MTYYTKLPVLYHTIVSCYCLNNIVPSQGFVFSISLYSACTVAVAASVSSVTVVLGGGSTVVIVVIVITIKKKQEVRGSGLHKSCHACMHTVLCMH